MRADEIGAEIMAALSEAGFQHDTELTLQELFERVFGDADELRELFGNLGAIYGYHAIEVIAEAAEPEEFLAWLGARFALMFAAGALYERRGREEMERLAKDGGNDGD